MLGTKRAALSLLFVAVVNTCYTGAQGQPASVRAAGGPTHRAASSAPPSNKITALDFEFFETRVEPIFLKERPGHARCYGCHILPNRGFYLATLTAGSSAWTNEQSQLNFKSALDQVVPGDALASRLLTHPLAPEAGGDPFHSGGRQFDSQNDADWLVIAEWVRGAGTEITSESSSGPTARIYVTNSASDTVDVIDSGTNQVVQVIRGIALPHGIAFSSDGTRLYISNESESVLDLVDRKSGDILQKIPLSGRPNNIAITKDGARVLVGIRSEPGVVDVIDAASQKRTKSIAVDGSVHNVYVTPDGKFAVSGSIEFCQARRGGKNQVAGSARWFWHRRTASRNSFSRHRRGSRWEVAVGEQHLCQCRLQVFAARSQIDRARKTARGPFVGASVDRGST